MGYQYLCLSVTSPLDDHKSLLISLVISVIQGREKALVVAGLDLWCGILVLPAYLEAKEVGTWWNIGCVVWPILATTCSG